jgi:hypothetical protein
MESKILQRLQQASDEKYIYWVTLIFFLSLNLLNPSNKIIALSFAALFLLYTYKLKNVTYSIFYTFLSSTIIYTGKTYPIQIAPEGIFIKDIYPNGYILNLVITSQTFIALVMFFFIVDKFLHKKIKHKPNIIDLLIGLFFITKIFSAIIASKQPEISLPLEITGLSLPVAYFFNRLFLKTTPKFWKIMTFLFAALITFESVLGFLQLINKSPLGHSIESQVNIEYFGFSPDETMFTFRPNGTFDHANSLGIWTGALCVFLFAMSLIYNSNILWLSLLLGSGLLITTISRSAWLGYFTGILFTAYYIRKKKSRIFTNFFHIIYKTRVILLPLTIFLLFVFILPRAQSSQYSLQNDAGALFFRQIQNTDALELIKLHPFLGIGTGMSVPEGIWLNLNTLRAKLPLEVHNWYLNLALENGIPVLLIFIFFCFLYIKKLYLQKNNYVLKAGITGVFISSVLAAIFQPFLFLNIILIFISLTNYDNMVAPEHGIRT